MSQKNDVNELVTSNMKLVYAVIHKHYPTFYKDADIVQCGFLGLCKAANRWDEEKGIFSSFAYRAIRNEINLEFRRRMKQPQMLSLDYEINSDEGDVTAFGDFLVGEHDVELIDFRYITCQLTEKEKTVFNLLRQGVPVKDIADQWGCSREAIYKYIRKFKKLLKEESEYEEN